MLLSSQGAPDMLLHVTPDKGRVSCCWHLRSSQAKAGILQGLGKASSVPGGQWEGKASLAALAMPLHDAKLGEGRPLDSLHVMLNMAAR